MVPHNYLSVYFKPMSVDKFCWPHIKVRRSADSPLWAESHDIKRPKSDIRYINYVTKN